MLKILIAISVALSLQGCLTSTGNLQRESARMIVPTPYPDSVRVTDVHRGIMYVSWVATNAGDVYDCSADVKLTRPLCVKRPASR